MTPSFSQAGLARLIACVMLFSALSGCAAAGAGGKRTDNRVAIVAVVAAEGVQISLSRAAMTALLEEGLTRVDSETEVDAPLSHAAVQAAVGQERLSALADEFASTARLSPGSVQLLMASPLPVRRGLLVRLERNETRILEPASAPQLAADGRALADRHDVVLASRRDMRLAATLVDLNRGDVLWQRAWIASPVVSTTYVNYTGSSFTGSVAATLANSVVNGLRAPAAPPPASSSETLAALFRQLASELPSR